MRLLLSARTRPYRITGELASRSARLDSSVVHDYFIPRSFGSRSVVRDPLLEARCHILPGDAHELLQTLARHLGLEYLLQPDRRRYIIMAPTSAKVLVVDREKDFIFGLNQGLGGKCILIGCTSVSDALSYLRDLSFAAIVVAGDLGQGPRELMDFVSQVKPSFSDKPIIAHTSSSQSARLLASAGCTHTLFRRSEIKDSLFRLLGLAK
jgi:hypothetical protein